MELTVSLTPEQRDALQQGEAVRVIDPATQLECVVLRADVFERVRALLPDLDPRETYPAVDQVMREDWDDPKMAEYDDYDARKP